MELKAGPDDNGRRLDRILRKALPDHSLSLIHRLLRRGKVMVNEVRASPNERITAGDVILINAQPAVNRQNKMVNSKSFQLPEIVWRGSGIIVFNKPPGLASHGPDSLDTMVKDWLAGTLPYSLSFKPGPLHRLDRPTSGAIAFSESLAGAQLFTRLLREHTIAKTYLAIVEGCLSRHETWQDELSRNAAIKKTFAGAEPAGGQYALTTVKPLACNGSYTLIEARIATGRTHQIRAQAAFHGHPLAGDVKYGGHRGGAFGKSFFLHAWKLECREGAGLLSAILPPLTAPLPEAFLAQIARLFPGSNFL